MCLATVYKNDDSAPENKFAEYVTGIDIKGDTIRLTDITGEEKTIQGSLRNIDLVGNKIYIEPA